MTGESELSAFTTSLGEALGGLRDAGALHRYSVEQPAAFWRAWLAFSALPVEGDANPVCDEAGRFFPRLRLNYAESLLAGRGQTADVVAVTTCEGDGSCTRLSRAELRVRVDRLARALQARGVGEGDRVVAIPRSDAQAVVAVLAVAAVGASLAMVSPEMGWPLMVTRLRPLAPRMLLAHTRPMPHDSGLPLPERVAQVAQALPSLAALVSLDDGAEHLPRLTLPVLNLSDLLRGSGQAAPAWPGFAFDQPLFVTATAGPDGRCESLVHGAGGVLLEQVKEHRLHLELRPGDTLFAPASVASPTWLWQLSALASGCAIVLYNGPVRDAATLWRVAQAASASVVVTNAPYLRLGEHAGIAPGRELGLPALRALWYTGATLDEAASRWVHDEVKPVALQALCMSADMLGCLLLQRAGLPLDDPACRSLGLDVRELPEADGGGESQGRAGELVAMLRFPSRPLGFLDDPRGERFREAYLSRHPGAWASGRRVERSGEGALVVRGRVDGQMSVRGSRVAPAEVLAVVREFDEIREAAVVEQQLASVLGEGRAVLLVVMREGAQLDGNLIARVRRRLTEAASPAHVPDLMLAVPDLPRTADGAPCEEALRDLINQRPVRALARLRNPESLNALRGEPVLHAPCVPIGPLPPPPAPGWRSRQDHETYLRALWEKIFGFSPIGLDDDFFELGGHSLLAARIFADIQHSTQQNLAPSTLLKAPTIRQLAAVMDAAAWDLPVPLVQLRPGVGRPFFLVHSLAGTFLELWAVLRALDTQRAVYGLQARAVGDEHAPYVTVQEMAADYIGHMRRVQPTGPYAVGGYSFGGLVAYEIAQQLCRAGETVELVTLIDTHVHGRYLPPVEWMRYCAGWLRLTGRRLWSLSPQGRFDYLRKKCMVLLDRWRVATGRPPKRPELVGDVLREANFPPALRRVRGSMLVALRDYRPEPYPGRVVFLRAAVASPGDPMPVWRKVVRGGLEVDVTPGDHDEMISGANAKALALALARHL